MAVQLCYFFCVQHQFDNYNTMWTAQNPHKSSFALRLCIHIRQGVFNIYTTKLEAKHCCMTTHKLHLGKVQSHFLTLAKAAARRAAKVASAFLALSLAGRGLGMPVAFEALAPALVSLLVMPAQKGLLCTLPSPV